jgi:tellurite resistance protein TerC
MVITEVVSCTLTELSLSADNVMVWAVIIGRIGLPERQHRAVLAFGVGIAFVLRAVAIVAGAAALEQFGWLTYLLGAVLVWTGYRIARADDGGDDGNGFVMRTANRVLRRPALVAVAALGVTDLVFAVDSIPAAFAVTDDAATIAVANVVALAALWSMYGVVSRLLDRFVYLSRGLSVVMVWLGATMWLADIVHVSEFVMLSVIAVVLGASIVSSVAATRSRVTA